MKRPSFQFYPGDWLRDIKLRTVSAAARGLWMDILCLVHEGVPYGHLTINGTPVEAPMLARILALELKEVESALMELKAAGIPNFTPGGVMFSKRMVRDETVRSARAAGGSLSLKNPHVPRKKGYTSRTSLKDAHNGRLHPEEEEEDEDSSERGGDGGGVGEVACRRAAAVLGMPEDEGTDFFRHYSAQGWVTGSGLPIVSWKDQMHRWKTTWDRKQVSEVKTNGRAPSINSIAQADSVIAEAQKEIERIKSHSENYEWDGGLKKGITLSAQQRISDLRSKITETREIKTKHT